MVDYRRSAVAANEPAIFVAVFYNDAGEELSGRKADNVSAATAGVAIIRKLRGRIVVLRLNGAFYYV